MITIIIIINTSKFYSIYPNSWARKKLGSRQRENWLSCEHPPWVSHEECLASVQGPGGGDHDEVNESREPAGLCQTRVCAGLT